MRIGFVKLVLLTSILSFLAHIPGTALSAGRVATDGAEIVTAALAKGAAYVDEEYDRLEEVFHVTSNAKAQPKAQARAKKAKSAKGTGLPGTMATASQVQ